MTTHISGQPEKDIVSLAHVEKGFALRPWEAEGLIIMPLVWYKKGEPWITLDRGDDQSYTSYEHHRCSCAVSRKAKKKTDTLEDRWKAALSVSPQQKADNEYYYISICLVPGTWYMIYTYCVLKYEKYIRTTVTARRHHPVKKEVTTFYSHLVFSFWIITTGIYQVPGIIDSQRIYLFLILLRHQGECLWSTRYVPAPKRKNKKKDGVKITLWKLRLGWLRSTREKLTVQQYTRL